MKTHYELLGLEPSADPDAIKKAFRREIARYHPDKVIHLGMEFQEMAATRAAELTVAYKTLTDPALREEYDANIHAPVPPAHVAPPPKVEPREERSPSPPPPPEDFKRDRSGSGRFAAERAGRDSILKRAIAGRVHGIVEALYGRLETPAVRGFDLVLVPVARPRFLGAPPPRVLLKVIDKVDGNAITEAYAAASRARLHSGKSPVVVLLFGVHLAAPDEISSANDANLRQRKGPDAPEETAVVVVHTADWSCRLPPNSSTAVHKLTDRIASRT